LAPYAFSALVVLSVLLSRIRRETTFQMPTAKATMTAEPI